MMSLQVIVILLIAGYAILFTVGIQGIATLYLALGSKKRRAVDISNLGIYPPAKLHPTVDSLSKLGFRRLGEVSVKFLGIPKTGWIFISPNALVQAVVTEIAPQMVTFSTIYDDNAVVETGFPFGENIDTPYYRSHTVTSDLEKAYARHTDNVSEFNKNHGVPRKLEFVEDYLSWDTLFREQYGLRKFSHFIWIGILEILALGYGFITTLVVAVSAIYRGNLTSVKLYDHLLILLKVLSPAVILGLILSLVFLWRNRRETKPA